MSGEVAEIALMTDSLGAGEPAAGAMDACLAQLVERAKRGDTEAFEQIMIRYERKVIATAWRLLGSREDGRDAAQEVFLRVYKYLKGYRANQDFAAWLYKITVNVCRDSARRRGRTRQFASIETEREAAGLDALASDADVEAAAIQSQQQKFVAEALSQLPKKERAAIVLRDLEGLSTEEVARALGSSQATVRSQISSARAKIKAFHDRLVKQKRRG